jgi:hypothetical protein
VVWEDGGSDPASYPIARLNVTSLALTSITDVRPILSGSVKDTGDGIDLLEAVAGRVGDGSCGDD